VMVEPALAAYAKEANLASDILEGQCD